MQLQNIGCNLSEIQLSSSTQMWTIRKICYKCMCMSLCGLEVLSQAEIKEGDTIITRCKVSGCETEWVCKPHPHGFIYLLTGLFSVPLCMYNVWFCPKNLVLSSKLRVRIDAVGPSPGTQYRNIRSREDFGENCDSEHVVVMVSVAG